MADEQTDAGGAQVANVTAAELVRGFARWRDAAQVAPVHISTHGRVTHVLSSAEHFRRTSLAGAGKAAERRHILDGLADYVHEGVMVLDADDQIIFANKFAKALCDVPDLEPGTPLLEAMPLVAGSPFEAQIRRTASSFEPHVSDLPSVKREGRWLNFQTLPLNGNVVLVFRDITDEVQSHRLANVKEAALHAISVHPDVAYIRITPTGAIERVDDAFSGWIGLPSERLKGVKLVDVVDRKSRVRMSEAIDAVLAGNDEQLFTVHFNPNREGSFAAKCSAVALRGAYGLEGAIIICSHAPA